MRPHSPAELSRPYGTEITVRDGVGYAVPEKNG